MSLLEQAGEALYGPRWQTDLARALDVNDRTVRRWVSGETPLPDGVIADLLVLCDRKARALAEVSATLRAAVSA